MIDQGIGDSIFNRFDSKSCIISRREGLDNMTIDQDTIENWKVVLVWLNVGIKISNKLLKEGSRS